MNPDRRVLVERGTNSDERVLVERSMNSDGRVLIERDVERDVLSNASIMLLRSSLTFVLFEIDARGLRVIPSREIEE